MSGPDTTAFQGMVLIPGSEFTMGSRQGSGMTSPWKRVITDSFYIDIYPVTNEDYAGVISDWRFDPRLHRHPVVGLSRDEIREYCDRTGKRLPTEAEWERAARGDADERVYPWGDTFSSDRCNCKRSLFMSRARLTPVDAFPGGVSPCGCFDMAGNVWEWTDTTLETDQFVLKGGSFTSPSRHYLTIASRLVEHKSCVNSNFGFRCCRSVEQ